MAYGGTVNPPRYRKGRAGNPPPTGARASALPDGGEPNHDGPERAPRGKRGHGVAAGEDTSGPRLWLNLQKTWELRRAQIEFGRGEPHAREAAPGGAYSVPSHWRGSPAIAYVGLTELRVSKLSIRRAGPPSPFFPSPRLSGSLAIGPAAAQEQ